MFLKCWKHPGKQTITMWLQLDAHNVLLNVWAGHKFKCATVPYNYFFKGCFQKIYANHNKNWMMI